MKYTDVNWEGFESIPSEEVYTQWHKARKQKHGFDANQAAINLIRPHINKLARDHCIEADQAFSVAGSLGWRSIKVAWVIKWESEDMDSYSNHTPQIIEPSRDIRSIPIEEKLRDRSWALQPSNTDTRRMTPEQEFDRGWALPPSNTKN